MDHSAITERIEAIRLTAGLTRAAMARVAGMAPQQYSDTVSGKVPNKSIRPRAWSVDHLERIAEALGQSLDWIVRGRGKMRYITQAAISKAQLPRD